MAANSTLDVTSLSKRDLTRLKRQVEEALAKTDLRRRQDALAAVKRAVKEFGFSLEEILAFQAAMESKNLRRLELFEKTYSGTRDPRP